MNNDPKISVVVPTYNVQASIERCLSSILSQTYKNLELIVVDDGSTDQTRAIVSKMAERDPSRVRLFCQQNAGAGSARNKGLSEVCGEYVVFVDSDDFLDDDFLESMMNVIGDNDLAISGYRCIENGRIKFVRQLSPASMHEMFRQQVIWAKIYRTEFLKDNELAFDVTIKSGQDVVFSFEAYSKLPNTVITDYVGYNYVLTSGSITHNPEIQKSKNAIALLDNIAHLSEDSTEFWDRYNKEIVFACQKIIVDDLVRKSKMLDDHELIEFECRYFDWAKSHFGGACCNLRVDREDPIHINLAVNVYVLARKLNAQNLFLRMIRRA